MKAKRQAAEILDRLEIRSEPVDVRKVATSLKLRVLVEDLGVRRSGLLVRDGAKAYICVNKRHKPNRRRFTIAHEIGHYVLNHQGDNRHVIMDNGVRFNWRDDRSSQGTDFQEIEANSFAAALLMPEQFIRRAIEDSDMGDELYEEDIEILAKRFNVSPLAMQYRLSNLRII